MYCNIDVGVKRHACEGLRSVARNHMPWTRVLIEILTSAYDGEPKTARGRFWCWARACVATPTTTRMTPTTSLSYRLMPSNAVFFRVAAPRYESVTSVNITCAQHAIANNIPAATGSDAETNYIATSRKWRGRRRESAQTPLLGRRSVVLLGVGSRRACVWVVFASQDQAPVCCRVADERPLSMWTQLQNQHT